MDINKCESCEEYKADVIGGKCLDCRPKKGVGVTAMGEAGTSNPVQTTREKYMEDDSD